MSVRWVKSDPSPFSSESRPRYEPYGRASETDVTPSLISRISRTWRGEQWFRDGRIPVLNARTLMILRLYYDGKQRLGSQRPNSAAILSNYNVRSCSDLGAFCP